MDIKLKTGTAGFCGCCWGGCRFEFKTGEDMFESHTYVFVFMSSDSQTHTGVLLAKTDMNILKEIQYKSYYIYITTSISKTVNSAALALFQENNHLHIIKS